MKSKQSGCNNFGVDGLRAEVLKYGFCNKVVFSNHAQKWGQICCKSVQLVRGSSFRNDLLQNPYFKSADKYINSQFSWNQNMSWERKKNCRKQTVSFEFLCWTFVNFRISIKSKFRTDTMNDYKIKRFLDIPCAWRSQKSDWLCKLHTFLGFKEKYERLKVVKKVQKVTRVPELKLTIVNS